MQMHQIVSIKHMQFLTVSFVSKKAILKICLFTWRKAHPVPMSKGCIYSWTVSFANLLPSWVWWLIPVILVLGKLRQEHWEWLCSKFEANLGYMKLYPTNKTKTKLSFWTPVLLRALPLSFSIHGIHCIFHDIWSPEVSAIVVYGTAKGELRWGERCGMKREL